MNLDSQIVELVRQNAEAVPLHHLCLLMFPTFTWAEMQGGVASLVRWRCHELAQEGILLEIGADLSISVGEGGRGRVAQA